MGIITISWYSSYYNFIIVFLLDLFSTLIKGYFEEVIYSDINRVNLMIELLNLIFLNVADLLAGILVLYTYKNSKSIKSKELVEKHTSKNSIELIYNDLSIKRNKFYLILIISILEFIGRSTDFFYYLFLGTKRIRDGEITWLISIDILSRILFSYIILESKLYKHHILSIILTIIGLSSMSICAFIVINSEELTNWIYFLFIALKFIVIPLEDVINKILLTNKFLLPQTLIFWRGLYNLGMFFILIPILKYLSNFNFSIDFNNKQLEYFIQILLVSLFVIFLFFKSFFTMKVIYIFSPQHIAFINVVFYMIRLLRCRIYNNDVLAVIISDIFFLIIIIFSTLIFNEMIIIESCGLNENTKNGFLIKEEREFKDLKSSRVTESEDTNKSRDSF